MPVPIATLSYAGWGLPSPFSFFRILSFFFTLKWASPSTLFGETPGFGHDLSDLPLVTRLRGTVFLLFDGHWCRDFPTR